jgi:hypothetical protein
VKTVEQSLATRFRALIAATVVLYAALIGIGTYGYVTRSHDLAKIDQVTTTTKQALCLFRENIEKQVATSEEFLEENPDGIPGLPAATIKASIQRQKDTLKALDILECGKEEK